MAIVAALRTDPMKFLRNVLRANAAFSTLNGFVMIVGGTAIGAWLGKPGSVAPDGMILLAFGRGDLVDRSRRNGQPQGRPPSSSLWTRSMSSTRFGSSWATSFRRRATGITAPPPWWYSASPCFSFPG